MQDLRHAVAVNRTRAPEGKERHAARILAALPQVRARGIGHVLVHHPMDTPSHSFDSEAERFSQAGERAACSFYVESHLSAEKITGIQVSQYQVGIRHGRFFSASAVACRTGIG